MQMSTRKITARQCAYEALKNEGTYSLYKGVAQPIVGATPINTIIFCTEEVTKEYLHEKYPHMSSSSHSLFAGALAGTCSLSVFVPMDLLKCRAQMTKTGNLNYSEELWFILREQGFSGLYRGLTACAARDIPGWAVYFSAYDYIKTRSTIINQKFPTTENKKKWRDFVWTLNAGGTAGVLSWGCSIPQDIIKNK